ncbi:MAG: hypothetical protein AAF471_07365, partial [Myxococcota bacterium]
MMQPVFLTPFLLVSGVLAAGCSSSPVVVQNQGVELARATSVGINPSQIELASNPSPKDVEQDKQDEVQPEETKQFIVDLCSASFAKRQAAIYELNQRLTAGGLRQQLKHLLVDPNCWSFALDAMEKQGDLDDDTLSDALVRTAGDMNLADRQKTRHVEKRFDPYFERLLRKVRRKGDPGPGLGKLVNRLKNLVKSGDKGPAVVIFVKVVEHAEKEIARHPEIINQLGVPVAEAIQEGIFDDEETSLKFLDLVERHASQHVQAAVYTHIASGIREGTMANERVAKALLDNVEQADRAIIDRVVTPLAETLKKKGVVFSNALAQRSVRLFGRAEETRRNHALRLAAQGVESGILDNTVTIAGMRGVADAFGRTSWDAVAPYFARRIGATGRLGDDVNAQEALRSIGRVASLNIREQTVRDVAPTIANGVNGIAVHADTALRLVELMDSAGVAGLDTGAPHIATGIANGNVNDVAVAQEFFRIVVRATNPNDVADNLKDAIALGPAGGL